MKEIKEVDGAGLAFIAKEEGCMLHVYRDVVGIPTLGIGCTYYPDGRRVQMTDPPITKEQALAMFKNVLKHYELAVWSSTRDDISQQQFNALVSLCFNIGVGAFKGSTVLKRVNANPSDGRIRKAFAMWHRAGNKRGVLLERRKREAALYFS